MEKIKLLRLVAPDFMNWKSIILSTLVKNKNHYQAFLLGADNMKKLVAAKIFYSAESLDDLPETIWLDINDGDDLYEVERVDNKIHCLELSRNSYRENSQFEQIVYEFTLDEFCPHKFSRENFYALMANELGITPQVCKLGHGLWEVGRKNIAGKGRAKFIFVEQGVEKNDIVACIALHGFKSNCLLFYGKPPSVISVPEKNVIFSPIFVDSGNFLTEAFDDLAASTDDLLPCRDEDLLKALDQVRPKIRGELALITPTNQTVIPHISSVTDNVLLKHATLSQLLSVAENGTLTSVRDVTECFTISKSLNRQADASDSSNGPTEGGGGLSHEDLSKQIEQGFNSMRIQTVESAIAANEMRKELEEISGRADALLTQLVVGFGSNKDMANLFMRMLATGADGKKLSYAKIGAQIGITKQAVEARFRKMAAEYPHAHRHLKTIRSRDKTTQFSALAPKERRKQGVDESYDYDAD